MNFAVLYLDNLELKELPSLPAYQQCCREAEAQGRAFLTLKRKPRGTHGYERLLWHVGETNYFDKLFTKATVA